MAVGKKITDLTESGSLKDTDLAIVHDGNGTKRSTLTQLGEYMGTKFSNPNLLINPDFKINQRGQEEYNNTSWNKKYTVDRWRTLNAKVKTNADGTITVSVDENGGYFGQQLENKETGDHTITCNVSSVTGNVYLGGEESGIRLERGINILHTSDLQEVSMHLQANASVTLIYIKLEKGSIATPFVAPNQAEELLKCLIFTHVISMDNLIGTVNGNKVFVRISSPIKEGATIKYLKGYMSIAVENEGKDINVGSANIANKGSYVLAFNTNSDTNYVWKACVMSNFTILLDAEIY